MLPIHGSTIPATTDALRDALVAGFARYGIAPKGVTVDGSDVKLLSTLSVDLSDVNVTRAVQPPRDLSIGQESLTAAVFQMAGQPVLLEGVPATFSISGENVRFTLAEGDGQTFLAPQEARTGQLQIEVTREALESLIQKIGSEAAGKQGVEIKEVHVELISKGDRALSFRADVVGKVFLMKAPVSLTGDVAIDDQLDLHLSNLAVGGSGMIANLANGFAQPYLKRAQAQPISLAMLNLGSMKVTDIRLEGGPSLRIEAKLAS